MHIVWGAAAVSEPQDAVALRREWEQWRAEQIADSHRRRAAELQRQDTVDAKADVLRDELGSRLAKLMEDLEPYVDGTMGEVTVGMVNVYVKAAHELAGLYNLTRAPRKLTVALPLPEPAQVEDEATATAARVAAVTAARAEGLRQLEAVKEKMQQGQKPLQLEAS